jgi:hypothetical protein
MVFACKLAPSHGGNMTTMPQQQGLMAELQANTTSALPFSKAAVDSGS